MTTASIYLQRLSLVWTINSMQWGSLTELDSAWKRNTAVLLYKSTLRSWKTKMACLHDQCPIIIPYDAINCINWWSVTYCLVFQTG